MKKRNFILNILIAVLLLGGTAAAQVPHYYAGDNTLFEQARADGQNLEKEIRAAKATLIESGMKKEELKDELISLADDEIFTQYFFDKEDRRR